MATLNLGRIKPVFQGAYNNSTAYIVDDIVTFGDETFICIQASTGNATSNASYWTKLAAKGTNGTNGTDLSTTLTTRGDIVYKGASALERLAKGTTGQVLKQGANDPEWGTDAGGSILAVSHKADGDTYSIATTNRTSNYTFTGSSYEISNLTITMTPSASTSKFMINLNLQGGHKDSYVGIGWLTYQVSGGTEYAIAANTTRGVTFRSDGADFTAGNVGTSASQSCCVIASPNTTSAVTFRVRVATSSSTYPWFINRTTDNNTDIDDGGYMLSTMTVSELAGANSTVASTNTNFTKT